MPLAKTLRITGGKLVKRRFLIPPLLSEGVVRPATDRIRESLFSIIKDDLADAAVLDIFAGSGAYGFESISRDAKHVTFIEKNKLIADSLRKSVEMLDVKDKCSINLVDAFDFVFGKNHIKADVIFLDPPYALDLPGDFWQSIKNFLNDNGFVVFRAFKKNAPNIPDDFEITKEKVYGSSRVFLIRLKIFEEKK